MDKPEVKTVKTLHLIKCMHYTQLTHFPNDANLNHQLKVRTRTWMILTHGGFIEHNNTYVSIPFANWVDDEDPVESEIPEDIRNFMRHMVNDFDLKLNRDGDDILWEITW